MMHKPFDFIGITGRLRTPDAKDTIVELIHLIEQCGKRWIIHSTLAQQIPNITINQTGNEETLAQCDLLIVIGGDGSFLGSAHRALPQRIPMLGINRGTLGFLTDILPQHLGHISPILSGNYILEERFILEAKVVKDDTVIECGNAINEVILLSHQLPQMLHFDVFINDQFVCTHHADGFIIATPTGSTAYSLSGGGPILHPQSDALVLLPMFSHTLSSRPLVISSSCLIKIYPKQNYSARIAYDAQHEVVIPPGGHIIVQKKTEMLKLVHPAHYDYYETLRSKLHWEKKPFSDGQHIC
jgi:NAD+ kinase